MKPGSKNHFKFFCKASNSFIHNYKYSGYVEELFDDYLLIPCQCTGMRDAEGQYIYENDIIEFDTPITNKHSKKHTAFITYNHGAFLVLAKSADSEETLTHMWLHDLSKEIFNWKVRVIGSKLENTK